jgi:hypothetical protein
LHSCGVVVRQVEPRDEDQRLEDHPPNDGMHGRPTDDHDYHPGRATLPKHRAATTVM